MASSKKRNKWTALDRKERQAGQPPRPPRDGDRRRRGLGLTVREAVAHKRAMQGLDLPEPPEDGPAGDDSAGP